MEGYVMKLKNISLIAVLAVITISSIDSRGGGHSGGYHGGSRGYNREGRGYGYGAGAFATGVALGTVASVSGDDYYDDGYTDYSGEPQPAVVAPETGTGFDNPIYDNETEVGHENATREFYYHKASDARR